MNPPSLPPPVTGNVDGAPVVFVTPVVVVRGLVFVVVPVAFVLVLLVFPDVFVPVLLVLLVAFVLVLLIVVPLVLRPFAPNITPQAIGVSVFLELSMVMFSALARITSELPLKSRRDGPPGAIENLFDELM